MLQLQTVSNHCDDTLTLSCTEDACHESYTVLSEFMEVDEEVIAFFAKHDEEFYPSISSRSSVVEYIRSIFGTAGRLIVCHIHGKIVGIIGIGLNHPAWKYYYQYISVDAQYRRRGIAGKLLELALQIFKEHGATRIVVRTWSSNKASRGNFHKHGFIHFDTLANDRGAGVHSCFYTKVLSPLQLEKPLSFLGLIGGMGTFATGNFVKTLSCIPRSTPKEQSLMPFLVINDPTIPDRTEAIYQNTVAEVVSKVEKSINRADQRQLSHLAILCFTFHPFIPLLRLRRGIEVINLIDLCSRLLGQPGRRWLLVATLGTYKTNPFCSLPVLTPADPQKERIHQIILEIKSGACPSCYRDELIAVAKNNDCNALVLGCTDLHGMFGFYQQYQGVTVLDPLLELALHLETVRVNTKTNQSV